MYSFDTQVFNATANTGTPASAAIDASFINMASAQCVFSDSAAAGTLKLQSSNDPTSPSNWNDIPNASVSVASGATSTTPTLSNLFAFKWIRVVFARSGGAGTITGYLKAWGG